MQGAESTELALAEEALERGREAEARRDLVGALKLYLHSCSLDSTRSEAISRAAHTAEWLERFDVAWSLLEKIGEIESAAREWDAYPQWDGQPVDGKTLLVWKRMRHVGAELRNASMIPEAQRRARRCIVECDPRLTELFARSFPGIEVVARSDDPHALDTRNIVQASYERLGALFRTRAEHFPRATGFLVPSPERARSLRDRYEGFGSRPIVGISWSSTNQAKELPSLADWAPLLAIPGIAFVSLQYGDCEADLRALESASGRRVWRDPEIDPLHDLDGAAAQIAAMDLVVSISNTTAHMAGGAGMETWVLLDTKPLLIWPVDRRRTLFYPTVELHWRPAAASWAAHMRRTADRLRAWRASRS